MDKSLEKVVLPKFDKEKYFKDAEAVLAQRKTVEEVADIKTAVSEAVTNSIIHGYEDHTGIVKLACKIIENEIFLEISDSGKGIENVEIAKQPLYTTKSNLERSGMGFTIMESFMDDVEVESMLGVGTKVKMKKRIKSRENLVEAIASIRGDE